MRMRSAVVCPCKFTTFQVIVFLFRYYSHFENGHAMEASYFKTGVFFDM